MTKENKHTGLHNKKMGADELEVSGGREWVKK